ncbi:MAG: hypothetical protein ABF532_09085 [Bifidobacterium sp.]|uniref:hypothetical protein n=1 Tax=Bifidobacterium sp. TaxID=41200 RepID=UPI0039E89E15
MTERNRSHDKREKFLDTMRRKAQAERARRMEQRDGRLDAWDVELLSFNEELHAMWALTRELMDDYGMTRERLVERASLVRLSRQTQALFFAQSDPATRLDYLSLGKEAGGEEHVAEPSPSGDAPGFDRPEQ